MVEIKRAYEPRSKGDGYRILVDRLWPRGIEKNRLHLDDWDKELAPSAELRKEFSHNPNHWKTFRTRYLKELRSPALKEKLNALTEMARSGTVTLIYSARDEEHNNAVVLKEVLKRKLDRKARQT